MERYAVTLLRDWQAVELIYQLCNAAFLDRLIEVCGLQLAEK
jgi:hypothetical protein